MLAIFDSQSVPSPPELQSPASFRLPTVKPKLPREIINHFVTSGACGALSMSFGNAASIAFDPSRSHSAHHQMLFCGLDEMYCMFKGSLNNLSRLNKQYGLSKATNEAMFVIEAYRTLRDRGPYPADQVLKELEGNFAFVVFDRKAGTVFAALDAREGMNLYWGTAGDGSLVISDNLEVIKVGCAKSFAPFPPGCMFHSERGLMSFEHPTKKMKAMPRIDSEGVMCGANFKVDVQSRVHTMPRVGSEANWATWGSHP
ncbi:stem-specific protein TSJT1-like [Benincasa hispida]|uniref:stem-specific protein TSJT1-like n=1 Tax=Benincasa hispida TaxID=102211 RepID=UPI0019000A95|nr:stem-specific protein TSJT1-like [Benincasa hispida]